MHGLSISNAWDETQRIIARDGRLLASVALALIVFPETVLAVVGFPMGVQPSLISSLVYLLVILLGFTAQIAVNRLAIGPGITVGGAIRRGFQRLLPVIAALLALAFSLFLVLMIIALILGLTGLAVAPGLGQQPPPAIIVLLLMFAVLSFAVCQLFVPVAAAEPGGPIRLFARSWELARPAYLRLLAFVIMVFAGILLVGLIGQFVFGSAVLLTLGPPRPGTVAALVLGLFAGILQAAFAVTMSVMLARIYIQLAGRDSGAADVRVPKSGT